MIEQVENAIIAALKEASDAGKIAYIWRTLDSYPDDFDAYLKEKKQLRMPAAWSVFLALSSGENSDDDDGWTGEASFALVVADQNRRGETETRHGGPDRVTEPGVYLLTEDAIRVLDGSNLGGLLARAIVVKGARPISRTAEMRTQGMALVAIELNCKIALGQFADLGNMGDFAKFHADWDLPPVAEVTGPLPIADPDAEDLVELPQ